MTHKTDSCPYAATLVLAHTSMHIHTCMYTRSPQSCMHTHVLTQPSICTQPHICSLTCECKFVHMRTQRHTFVYRLTLCHIFMHTCSCYQMHAGSQTLHAGAELCTNTHYTHSCTRNCPHALLHAHSCMHTSTCTLMHTHL